jgi:hypothetical protein
MSIEVIVRYSQNDWGKTLFDTYTRTLNSRDEIRNIYEALYEDPCVTHVEVIEISNTQKELNGGDK